MGFYFSANTTYPNDPAFNFLENFTFEHTLPHFVREQESLPNAHMIWMEKNFYRLNVYFLNTDVQKYEEAPLYPLGDLGSSIGEVLGLWIGVSVLTLTEILSVLIDFCSRFKKREIITGDQ